jgi:excinuclease ABC subunit A
MNARENNLRTSRSVFRVGLMTCVTGVSGSGKSTLVNDVLCRALFRHFYHAKEAPGAHDAIDGLDLIDKAIVIDQTPIGRTPRSNPLTYTGAFNPSATSSRNCPRRACAATGRAGSAST